MRTIQGRTINEIVINKSVFITYLFRVNDQDEANLYLAEIRKKHYDATHNCYAYIIGDNQNIQKASDDGEPAKTAGFPMLDVLKKQNLTNVLAVTTRYFGGILLGAGGLVRAYSSSVSEALKHASIYEYMDLEKISLTISYSLYSMLESEFKKYQILDTIFTDNVTIFLGIKPELVETFLIQVENYSAGKAQIMRYGLYQMESLIDNEA